MTDLLIHKKLTWDCISTRRTTRQMEATNMFYSGNNDPTVSEGTFDSLRLESLVSSCTMVPCPKA